VGSVPPSSDVSQPPVGASGSGIVQIDVNRGSTAAERAALLNVLKKEGAEKLLDALQDTRPVGIIKTPDSLGYDLQGQRHAVVRHEDPSGRRHDCARELRDAARDADGGQARIA
jgi:hypothetical protein